MFSTMYIFKTTYAGLEGPAWGRLPIGNGAEKAEPRKARDERHGSVFYKMRLVEPLGLPSIKKLPSMPLLFMGGNYISSIFTPPVFRTDSVLARSSVFITMSAVLLPTESP